MDDQEAERLNADLLAALRESVPWAAEQIDESVRQGTPIAKKVRLSGGMETVSMEASSGGPRRNQFTATQDLTGTERLRITLDAIERLLVDPASIADNVRRNMQAAQVSKVEFTEPNQNADERRELGGLAVSISSQHRERILMLLKRLRLDIDSA